MLGKWFKRNNSKTSGGTFQRGNDDLIHLNQVVKNFNTVAGTFTALKGVDLRVSAGEFVAVIGKSGSGKSTLVNMITGIDRPTSGQVFVGDTAIHTLTENQMAIWRGKNLGIVFQFFQLLPTLSIVDNVMLPMDFCNVYKSNQRYKHAMELLDEMEMADHAHKLPSAISGGQQQRVAIARALANDPPILLADEPTGNLDSNTANTVFAMFEKLVDQGKTILMVTHDQDLAKRVTRAVNIVDGMIIEKSLSETFPGLSQEQLVEITHRVDPDKYAPGTVILQQGTEIHHLHIILRGTVEIVVRKSDGKEIVVATMRRGEFFGEIEMQQGGLSSATVRASTEEPVEVLKLDRTAFEQLVNSSPGIKATIDRIVQQRMAENRAARASEASHA